MPPRMVEAYSPTRISVPDHRRCERAGEGDVAEGVAGEDLCAEDDEVADQAAGEPDEGARDQRVAHELVREHQAGSGASERCSAGHQRPGDADEQVERERERRDVEADRIDREVGERKPEPGDGESKRDREGHSEPGRE